MERFARESPGVVFYDPERSLLFDAFSGKSLPLDWGTIASLDEGRDRITGRAYLQVTRDDGRVLFVADAGVAFAPDTTAVGPLEGAPAAVCFRDLSAAEAQLGHFLTAHSGEPPGREHLDLFRFCLAIVDGARAAGFDVGPEERRLERLLAELEARRSG